MTASTSCASNTPLADRQRQRQGRSSISAQMALAAGQPLSQGLAIDLGAERQALFPAEELAHLQQVDAQREVGRMGRRRRCCSWSAPRAPVCRGRGSHGRSGLRLVRGRQASRSRTMESHGRSVMLAMRSCATPTMACTSCCVTPSACAVPPGRRIAGAGPGHESTAGPGSASAARIGPVHASAQPGCRSSCAPQPKRHSMTSRSPTLRRYASSHTAARASKALAKTQTARALAARDRWRRSRRRSWHQDRRGQSSPAGPGARILTQQVFGQLLHCRQTSP